MKKIGVSHLVYIIIIFMIVLSFFLVIAFGGTKNAGTMMGTASTVSSLILSVIAIVLSLLDVAGQRESMVDLKETADKLQESNLIASDLIQDLTLKMNDLQVMKEQMVDAVKESDEWRKELIEKIEKVTQTGESVSTEELSTILKTAKDLNIKSSLYNSQGINIGTFNTPTNPPSLPKVLEFIRKNYESNDEVTFRELRKEIQKNLNVSRSLVYVITNALLDNNYIHVIDIDPEGEKIIGFSDKLFK